MKAIFLFLTLLSSIVSADIGRPEAMSIIDTSSLNITNSYAGANSTVLTSLSGVTHVAVFNDTATNIAVAMPTGTSCTGAPDNLVAPDSNGVIADDIAVINVVCIRSLGATISSGTIYVSAW